MREGLSPRRKGIEWVPCSILIRQDVASTQRGYMLSTCMCYKSTACGLTQAWAEAKSFQSSSTCCAMP